MSHAQPLTRDNKKKETTGLQSVNSCKLSRIATDFMNICSLQGGGYEDVYLLEFNIA
jgi:hypothetical protein